jgi:8-oxo-dGTP diphosphatase
MTVLPERQSARLLILDPADRLLLFRYHDAHRAPFWATVGGMVQPGETLEQTAARELREETGFTDPIGRLVRERDEVFQAGDVPLSRWHEFYFEVRTPGGPVVTTGWTDEERRTIRASRWWTLAELQTTDEPVLPVWLAEVFATLVRA